MANTVVVYKGDGVTKQFTVPFDYLSRNFVHVIVNGVDEPIGVTWNFINPTTIERSAAPLVGETITIRRITSSNRLVEFRDASVLRSLDLNTSQLQILHIAEEANDKVVDTISTNIEGQLDARWRQIVNVANPTADSHAMSYGFYKADKDSVISAKNEAISARDVARLAEANTLNALGLAQTAQSNAEKARDAAKVSETAAGASAQSAKSSETAAGATKTAVETLGQEITASGQATLSSISTARQGALSDIEATRASVVNAGTTGVANILSAESTAVTHIQTESARFDTKLTTAEGYVAQAGASSVTAKNEADRAKTEADRAKAAADSVDMTVFEGRVSTLETDNTSNKGRISTLETDNTSNKSRLTTLESDNSTNKTAITNLTNAKLSKTGGTMTGDLNVRGASLRDVYDGLNFNTNGSKTGLTFEWCDGSGKTWDNATNAIMNYHELIKDTSMNEWMVGFCGGWKVNNANTLHSLHIAGSGKLFVDRTYELRYVRQTGGTIGAWWRLWSDGWIEQGGTTLIGANSTRNYNIPFNTFYGEQRVIMVTPVLAGEYWNLTAYGALETSKTTFDIAGINWTATNRLNWYACGF